MSRKLTAVCEPAVVVISLAMIACGGCSKTRQAFDAIELGKPLPDQGAGVLPRHIHRCAVGAACSEISALYVPRMVSISSLRVLTDDDGTVDAKSHAYFGGTIWGLLVSDDCHYVLEVDVPPEAFRDTPQDWGVDEDRGMDLALISCFGSLKGLQDAIDPPGPSSGPAVRPATQSASGPASTITRNAVRTRLMNAFAELAMKPPGTVANATSATATTRATAPAGSSESEHRPHVGLYMIATKALLDAMRSPAQDPDDIFGAAFLCLAVGGVEYAPFTQLGAFSGVTRPGYDWRHTMPDGVTCRVRNLGGRRIRLETTRVGVTSIFHKTEKEAAEVPSTQPTPVSCPSGAGD